MRHLIPALILLTACATEKPRPVYPACEADADCRLDRDRMLERCLNGSCQECVSDSDCDNGARCLGLICVPQRVNEATAEPVDATARATAQAIPAAATAPQCDADRSVFFDFDDHTIRPDQEPAIEANGECLMMTHPDRIDFEGHADNRGTLEYNLALGVERAFSVASWVSSRFPSLARHLTTHSWGETKPVCSGHGEECYAKNRRVETKGE